MLVHDLHASIPRRTCVSREGNAPPESPEQAKSSAGASPARIRLGQRTDFPVPYLLLSAALAAAAGTGSVTARADSNEAVLRKLHLPTTPFNYSKIDLPRHFAQVADSHDNTPPHNPLTDEGATLGRVLFYDKTLSVNGAVSCASCHKQEFAFSDGRKLSVGFAGGLVTRNSMSLINARYYANGRFFWDERAATLEEQVLMPIENRVEMGHSLPALVAQLQLDPIYPPLFASAFGTGEVTTERIARSLAQFIRSIVSCRSKYDEGRVAVRSVNDDFPNFTAEENRGKKLFLEQGQCADCHLPGDKDVADIDRQSALFHLERPAVNGVDGKLQGNDPGVGGHTGRQNELGAFKAPSLRNVALTAPYMHDGRFATLERVVEHYNWGVRPHPNLDRRLLSDHRRVLPEREKAALIAFLRTLTDHALVGDPRFCDPFVRHPEGEYDAAGHDGSTTLGKRIKPCAEEHQSIR